MNFSPPPTYAEVILTRPSGVLTTSGEAVLEYYFNPIWLKWFVDLAAFLSANSGGGTGASHNLLSGLQGGTANQYYHLTSAQTTALTAGFTGTGSIVRATSPVLVTPVLGTPTSGNMTNATGVAPALTAGNVTINANLTGPITSVGNATAVATQTGTGNVFVMNNAPTLINPILGNAAATNVTLGNAAALVKTSVTLNNGNGSAGGTLLNAPTAGDPSKWVPILDNGTIRYVPTWT